MESERPAIPPSPKPVGVIEQRPQEHYKVSSPPVVLRSASSRDAQEESHTSRRSALDKSLTRGGPYSSIYLGYEIVDGVSTDAGIIGVKANDPNLRVVNIATLSEFLHQVQLARQWFQAGYYPVDLPGDQVTANWRAGQYAMEIDVVHRDSLGQLKETYGYDFVAKGLGPLILTTSGIIATMNNISSTSKNPQAAMKVIEAFNNDLDAYHLICRGIEGKHYMVTDQKNKVVGFPTGITASNDRYNPQARGCLAIFSTTITHHWHKKR